MMHRELCFQLRLWLYVYIVHIMCIKTKELKKRTRCLFEPIESRSPAITCAVKVVSW